MAKKLVRKISVRLSANVCDWTILGVGLWTIITNLTALTGGGLLRLLFSFAFVSTGIYLWWRWRRKPALQRVEPRTMPQKVCPVEDPKQRILFCLVLGIAVGLTLFAHRPDADDAFFVNVAVASVDAPYAPILSVYSMNAPPFPPVLQAYKMHSFEMLGAALAWLTQTPVIFWFHLVLAPMAALLCILAYRDLFRTITPRYYAYGVLTAFVFLCVNGNVHASYGNFSFVRLHQGKGIFVSAILPLILTYGIRFAIQPTKRNWLLLSSAQITAIGMTSSALWIAPAVAAFSVMAGLPKLRFIAQAKRLLTGLTTSIYLVVIGIYIKLAYPWPELAFVTPLSSWQLLNKSLKYVFGYNRFAFVCLVIVLTAWILCESRLARRLCLIFPLGVIFFFFNPFVANLLATSLTGSSTYWRVFWLLPLPTIAALFFLSPLLTTKFRWPQSIRYGIFFLGLLGFLSFLPQKFIFSESNNTRMGYPGLKVPPTYQIAQMLNDYFDDRPNVLAPEAVAAWLPTFHQHPYPLLARKIFAQLYGSEGMKRLAVTRYIAGSIRPGQAQAVLKDSLKFYRIRAVCWPIGNPWAEEIRSVLNEAYFHYNRTMSGYEVWIFNP